MNASKSLAGLFVSITVLLAGLRTGAQSVTTSQYNNARTGVNQHETILTPRNVNVRRFGKILTLKVDGDIYAQPLFLAGLEIPGQGRHDVLLIATEHDSVYAFDAYGHPAAPLWRVSFLSKGVTTVPDDDVECPFISPEIGITSTPVIDADTETLYVLARTKESTRQPPGHYRQRLHALSVTTGVEKFGGPIDIKAVIDGREPAASWEKWNSTRCTRILVLRCCWRMDPSILPGGLPAMLDPTMGGSWHTTRTHSNRRPFSMLLATEMTAAFGPATQDPPPIKKEICF